MQAMSAKKVLSLAIFQLILFATATALADQREEEEASWVYDSVAKKDQQKTIASTEYGRISAVRVTDRINGSYLLHFFTLEPNALFLPVVLHADMVFYVHTGSGRLSWNEEDGLKHADLRPGDVYRLEQGTVFFLQSNLETETERRKLRFYAIFTNQDMIVPVTKPYSSIRDLVLGFDRKVLQAAFKVPEEVIEELMNGTEQPAIIHSVQESKSKKTVSWEIIQTQLGFRHYEPNKKKKKEASSKLFNLFKERKDFENCNGWSTTVTGKKLSALKGSNIGLFMVNLTAGSMMGPHWNPKASEISVVLQGHGMIHVVCSSPITSNETGAPTCSNARYEVEGGDVFVVPRYRPMAQMSFNNDTLVFVGFSTSTKKNHPQFLAGRASALRTLDEDVLAASLGARNSTLVSQLLSAQEDSVILGCVSCAEEEKRVVEEEIEREREREEEEARKREEERRREEEEARRREEERAKREEEERRRREQEEEEKRRREEEEEREREEAAARERQREEEEARKREEEEKARQEEEARKREQEEAKRRQEEEEARKREEERERERQEEEAAKEREQEEAKRRQEEEEERKREEARERQREQEEAEKMREEEEEERERQEEAEREKGKEEERRRREEEEERERQREEEAGERQREREEEERSEGERAAEEEARREEEAAREQERERREQEEGEEGGGGGGYEILRRLTI